MGGSIRIIAVAAATLMLAAAALGQTNLTLSSWVPPTHSVTKTLAAWGQDIEKASNGRLSVTMLPKAPMNPLGTLDGVATGLVDISFVSHGYTPGRFVLTKAAEMPFLGDSAEVNSVAYHRVYERTLAKSGEHKGLRVLAVFNHGPGLLSNTKKPVNSIADAAGMKVRVGGGLMQEIADAMGVNALLKACPNLKLLNLSARRLTADAAAVRFAKLAPLKSLGEKRKGSDEAEPGQHLRHHCEFRTQTPDERIKTRRP